MKRYCLNHNAKETIKEFLLAITAAMFIVFILITMIALPYALSGDATAVNLGYIGIINWSAFISAIVIWLKRNIVEC